MVRIIAEEPALGPAALSRGLILRDTTGRLSFFDPESKLEEHQIVSIKLNLCNALGGYAEEDSVVYLDDDSWVRSLLADPSVFPMQTDSIRFRLLDRRIVGSAWLDRPQEKVAMPPRVIFGSLKGGVGRSTALAVTASDLARRNKNVLVIDLDLEAPGIGDLLLDDDRMPEFGSVDYLVENGFGTIPEARLQDFVGTSQLTSFHGGRVDVVPALGKLADHHPGNTLAKLSRAMIEDLDHQRGSISVAQQIAEMVETLTNRDAYDVVLLDSRAGLSEITAPLVLGLGATVLLFGTDQRQTIRGYRALFAGLKLLALRDRTAGRRAEWRLRIKAVHAKASLDNAELARYKDDMYELFADNLYDEEDPGQGDNERLSFSIDDPEAPHWPLVIPFNQNLISFDPTRTPGQLSAAFYEQAYRPFLDGIDTILESSREESHDRNAC